jgi:hypothetical protein
MIPLLKLNLNIGVNYVSFVDDLPLFLVALAIVIFIETLLFHEYFNWKKSVWYSFVMNLISTIVGVGLFPWALLIFSSVSVFLPFVLYWLSTPIIVYVLTVLIEYFSILLLFKPNWKKKEMLKAIFQINVYSYLALIALFIFVGFVRA